ncbi:NIPSNAP family protein [Pseudomonas sp. DSP3-2-2]|uniref:NIPSNAP family protein n=1 Tax=unclassified Pseudomonas TaxID=196821 RepID=UPI003CE8B294
MIVEERIYKIRNGQMGNYMALVRDEGIEIQKSYLGHLIGYFSTEIGPLSHVVHMWAYESLDDRAKKRAALSEDPKWQAFIPKLAALIESAENRILVPASFSPLH